MGMMKRNGMCTDTSDCITTGLAFLVVLIEWVALLCWMMCDKLV